MFTEATLSLKEAATGLASLSVQRDCEFAFVGKVPTRLNQRIVPCRAASHIESALQTDGIVGIITTEALAAPKRASSIYSSRVARLVSRSGLITTPFPPARPSALITSG